MDGVRLRSAEPADASTVLAIKQAAIDGIDSPAYTDAQIAAWRPDDDVTADFRRAIRSDRFETLLAEIDGVAAGYAVLNAERDRIDAVFVRPEFAGGGVASSLVSQLESRARVRGATALTLVSSLNAGPFYESLQYRESGRQTRSIDGTEVEFAVMRKSLDG
ncbi:GNAT family N-acetyltransferase [Halovenus sp. WSH3]|uniref:GNAT family N-acetyltransferase n=1 Tax=Halovenus carboxidivorans TaxID=2692199 RepID=A0A6B0TBJ4_9EURY|nr:GNAT family N-acetyltransferase [Halovenus carboxidivorans]MXR50569.1 GNAT family N-acetyltransferase [Halovenus carboxidivorans]